MFEFSNHIKKNGFVDHIVQFIISIFLVFIRKVNWSGKNENSKILIISLHKLGDTVFTIPAVKALKKEFVHGITIVCYEDSQKIYELEFDDLKFTILKKNDFYFQGRIANSSSRKKIKAYDAGTIIDLTGAINSASLIFDNKAKRIIGFNEKYFEKIYTDYIPKRSIPHLMDRYLEVANIVIEIDEAAINQLKEFKKSLTENDNILIHPFAGWKAKEWEFEKFLELTKLLNENYSCKIIIPKELASKEILSEISGRKIEYLVSENVDNLISAIKNSFMVIGNDSGAVYIASLLGKPTFTIYGPTNPRFSLPFGEQHDFIQKEIKCSPGFNEQYCYLDAGRNCPTIDCMKSLTVAEVFEKIKFFLKREIVINSSQVGKGAKL